MRSLAAGICLLLSSSLAFARQPIRGEQPQTVADAILPEPEGIEVETWVDSLAIPWSLVFLPNGDALIAERPGLILRVPAGSDSPRQIATIDVIHDADIGLMGLALHPDFERMPYVYAMHTFREGEQIYTRVVRMHYAPEQLSPDRVILDRIPAAVIHAGGRIAFGPDGMLYIGTGDTGTPPLAQDLSSLAGKILRLTPDGEIPDDNPFPGSPVYSYGHRAVQGLAWDPATGAMFASEHGPSGFPQEGRVRNRDEINRILPGKNYGWPNVVGAPGLPEYQDPIAMWQAHSVPPSGIAFYEGDLFVSTLRTQALIRIRFGEDYAVESIERWFADNPNEGRLGRFRNVTAGPDGYLYVSTGNMDGKVRLRPGDDRILRIRYTSSPSASDLQLTAPSTADFEVTGDGSNPAWDRASWTPLSVLRDAGHGYATRVKMLYSDTGLYVLFDGEDNLLTASLVGEYQKLWTEDVFEAFFWTDERYPVYFEYEISPLGQELPLIIPNFGVRYFGWIPWQYEGERMTRKAIAIRGGTQTPGASITGWRAEVFVPYALLTPLQQVPPEPGTRWRANFYRVDHDGEQSSAWSWAPVGPSFHEFERYGTVVFE